MKNLSVSDIILPSDPTERRKCWAILLMYVSDLSKWHPATNPAMQLIKAVNVIIL